MVHMKIETAIIFINIGCFRLLLMLFVLVRVLDFLVQDGYFRTFLVIHHYGIVITIMMMIVGLILILMFFYFLPLICIIQMVIWFFK